LRLLPLLLYSASLSAQTLPWYLSDHYPQRSATGVPTNVAIMLKEERIVIESEFITRGMYTLKTATGTAVALNQTNVYGTDVAIVPTASLAANTQYTFTITPPPDRAAPYSFDFTTGAGPDKTPPRLLGFDPKPGTTGVGISGPFVALFDKRLRNTAAMSGAGISALVGGVSTQSFSTQTGYTLTADGKGIEIRPQPQLNNATFWPGTYQITVDPTKMIDAFGNAGIGPAQSAQYTTFAGAGAAPTLRAFFPADGETGLPLNVSIRLLYSRALSANSVRAVTLSTNGAPVDARVNSFAGGYGIELKPTSLLASNQTYRVTVGPDLFETTGVPAAPASFQFTTGSDADLVAAQAIEVGPPNPSGAASNTLIWLKANKRIMPLAAVEYTNPPVQLFSSTQRQAGVATISPDGQLFTFRATPPATGQSADVTFQDVVDVTGAVFWTSSAGFIAASPEDHDPPTIRGVTPPDGAQGLPVNAPIRIGFSEAVDFALAGALPRLTRDGETVPAKVTLDQSGTIVTIAPTNGLDSNATYGIDAGSLSDYAGNLAAPFTSTFTTGGTASSGGLKLVSASPANNSADVDVNTAISFTFDTPLSPLSVISGAFAGDSVYQTYPLTVSVSGATITLTPLHALLHDSTVRASVNVTDIYGRFSNSAQVSFRTASNVDTSPFRVISASPSPDATIAGVDGSIALTFSKPVNPTQVDSAITLYANGRALPIRTSRMYGDLTLVVNPSDILSTDVTLMVASTLTDVAGNALEPFRATYHYARNQGSLYALSVTEMRPGRGTVAPANSSITWFFTRQVDPDAAVSSLIVTANGAPVAGSFELQPDGATLVFRPSAPYPAGATVSVFQRVPLYGDTYGYSFTVEAGPATGALHTVRYRPGYSAPANSVIEVEFSQDVATGQGLLELQTDFGAPIVTTESHPRARVLRLSPKTPPAAGSYKIVISAKAGGGSFTFQLTSPVTSPAATLVAGPAANDTGVPTNASLRAAATADLNELSVLPANLTISVGGRTIPGVLSFGGFAGNGTLTLTPTEALPSNTEVRVSISGLEDIYGNALPAKSWGFTTAAGPDFTAGQLLEPAFGSGQKLIVPANAAVMCRFDRPLDPRVLASPWRSNAPGQIEITLSDDLRTLILRGKPFWAKGQDYSLSGLQLSDLQGKSISSPTVAFTVAFDDDLTAPQLLGLSPADGAAGMPLNTQILASFDEAVTGAGHVRLLHDGQPVPLVAFSDEFRRLRLAPVAPLLSHADYTLVLEGITDPSGNPMQGSVTRTFSTGDSVDTTAPAATVYANGASNAPLRILFSEPVSPATIDSRTVVFSKQSAMASSYYWIPLSASLDLSDDGRTLTITPRDPLVAGWAYQIAIGLVRDFAGNLASSIYSLNYPSQTFTESSAPDQAPPLPMVVPPDGSTGVAINTKIGVAFNEVILPPAGTILRVLQGGQPVPGKVTANSGLFTFVPDLPLTAGATYSIEVGSVTDLAGNVSAPVTTSFTLSTSSTPDSSALRLLSSSPANQEAGVPVDSPFVMQFSKPVDPTTLPFITYSSGFPSDGVYSTSGSTATFTPREPWPAGSTVQVNFFGRFGVPQDTAGNRLSTITSGVTFRTAASPDSTPPRLLQVSPENGTPLTPPSVTIRLTYDKTVAPAPGAIVAFAGAQQSTPIVSYALDDFHTLVVFPAVPEQSQLTVVGNDNAIFDRAHNAAAAFTLQYPTLTAETADRPGIASMTPRDGATNVATSTPIVVRFNKTMAPATLAGAVRVTQNGDNYPGRLDILDGNRTVQFTPDAPYRAGAQIDVFVLETVADLNGLTLFNRYHTVFTVAGTAPQTTFVDVTSFGAVVVPDAALELAFDRPVDPKTLDGESVWLRAGRRLIAGQLSLRGDRIVRFEPAAPLAEGLGHALTVSRQLRSVDGAPARPQEFAFTVQASAAAAEVETVEESVVSGEVAIHVRFTAPVDPLSLDGVRVTGDKGETIAGRRHVSVDFRDLWITPQTLPAGEARLRVDGAADRTGRRLPPGVLRIERRTR